MILCTIAANATNDFPHYTPLFLRTRYFDANALPTSVEQMHCSPETNSNTEKPDGLMNDAIEHTERSYFNVRLKTGRRHSCLSSMSW